MITVTHTHILLVFKKTICAKYRKKGRKILLNNFKTTILVPCKYNKNNCWCLYIFKLSLRFNARAFIVN